VFLVGCPLFGDPACKRTSVAYCGGWIKTPDGSCNNQNGRASAFPVDCVDSNNNGATIPECIGALVQIGGTLNNNGDPCNAMHEVGCSEDHWLTDGVIRDGDPRIIDTFTVFPGDLLDASGNTILPIRDFAAFYVTGWSTNGNGHQVNCPNGPLDPGRNEPAPANAPNVAIWGHWISYVVPGGGNGQPCNFNQNFGLCTPVLTR
jgi:hypothetical protein